MEVSEHNIIRVTTNRGVIHPKIVINAAGVTVDCLTAAEHDVLGADTDLIDSGSEDLAGCEGISKS